MRRISSHRRSWQRLYARRKPRDYVATRPGDIIQLDTVDIRPVPGVVLKQFTAIDVVSRWSVALLAHDATAASAKRALAAILARMPFAVRAIQVDGGSEFMNVFEETVRDVPASTSSSCRHAAPSSMAASNGPTAPTVKSSTTTPRPRPRISALSVALRRWEDWYNRSRPHQALAYKTPRDFLDSSATQLDRLDWLAQNLLELSKLDSGLVLLELRPDDLRACVESAVEHAEQSAERRGVRAAAAAA